MKIAYLIAAHTDPRHLQRLVKSLFVAGVTDFYIHVDLKSDINAFLQGLNPLGLLDKNLIFGGGITICKTRINTHWAGFSQCRYQKVLIDACLDSGIDYDYVFFLSGQDYPLWSNRRIIDFLTENKGKEFIAGLNISVLKEPAKLHWKLKRYHLLRDIDLPNGKLRRFVLAAARAFAGMVPVRKREYIVVNGRRHDVFQGSSWWCVSHKCLETIQKGMEEPDMVSYFSTSFAMDELFPQTVVFNSDYRDKAIEIKGGYKGLPSLTPLHYIEYGDAIKVFEAGDLQTLQESGKMFFRKAVTGKSDTLLDAIDRIRECQPRSG